MKETLYMTERVVDASFRSSIRDLQRDEIFVLESYEYQGGKRGVGGS